MSATNRLKHYSSVKNGPRYPFLCCEKTPTRTPFRGVRTALPSASLRPRSVAFSFTRTHHLRFRNRTPQKAQGFPLSFPYQKKWASSKDPQTHTIWAGGLRVVAKGLRDTFLEDSCIFATVVWEPTTVLFAAPFEELTEPKSNTTKYQQIGKNSEAIRVGLSKKRTLWSNRYVSLEHTSLG